MQAQIFQQMKRQSLGDSNSSMSKTDESTAQDSTQNTSNEENVPVLQSRESAEVHTLVTPVVTQRAAVKKVPDAPHSDESEEHETGTIRYCHRILEYYSVKYTLHCKL